MSTLALPWGQLAYDQRHLEGGARTASPERPPLVLLHGTGGEADHWDALLAALEHVGWSGDALHIAFRGHGRSEVSATPFTLDDLANDVAVLLDHLALSEATIVGHSLGGMVALAGEAHWPTACKLVLIEGWTRLSCAAHCGQRHMWGAMPDAQAAAIRADWQRNVGRCDAARWADFWRSVERVDARDTLARTQRDVLSIYGGIDLPDPPHDAMELPRRDNLPVRIIANAGHYTHLEQPDAVARAIADWLG